MRAGARPELSPDDGARPRAADLLANSPEQNPCGKICSHHGTRLDTNRISVLPYSTIIHNKTRSCRLVVISPAVSDHLRDISYIARVIVVLRPFLLTEPDSPFPRLDVRWPLR